MKYRVYVTDTLYAISNQRSINDRYIDWINTKYDNRPAEEIVADVVESAGLTIKE